MDEGLTTNMAEKTPMTQAYSSFSGLLLPKLLKAMHTLQSENVSLNETISDLEGSTPGGAGGSGGEPPESGGTKADMPFGEGMEALMGGDDVTFTGLD